MASADADEGSLGAPLREFNEAAGVHQEAKSWRPSPYGDMPAMQELPAVERNHVGFVPERQARQEADTSCSEGNSLLFAIARRPEIFGPATSLRC